ncbi:MAG: PQQ-binding-like beta-propeller repeat protein [Myxococcaceae bacterium]|nr:PQQ-binding-like beta-propeller repeat protein [Myxococcaceae bacterium]
MRRFFAIVVLTGLTACRERVSTTIGELRVGTPRVDLPTVYPGQTSRSERLELINASRSFRTGRIGTLGAPFTVENAGEDVTVAGADSVRLPLTFAPTEAGHFEQTLVIEDEDGAELAVLVTGTADPIPQCVSPTPCRTSAFDLSLGACIESPTNEGLDCATSNACYASATCHLGQCVGTAIDCNDADACSTDLCDPTRGCVHFPNTARCPAPPDACHVTACDPVVGCKFDDAPDGTRCGPSDCTTANICLLGQCRTVPVPAGATCGDDTPCQPKGRCNEGACVREPKTTLTAAWTVWSPPRHVVDWDSLADVNGNVYFRERIPGEPTSRLTSVAPNGTVRWKQELFLPQQNAVMDGLVMVRKQDGVEARRTSDGTVVWSRSFSTADSLASTRNYARGLGGSMYLGYVRFDAGFPLGSTLLSLNSFNGSTLWQQQLPAQAFEDTSMPVDENGYVYVSTWGNDARRRYLSFTPGGQQRWSVLNPHSGPAAVFGGRVYHWDHWLSETTDGGWVNERDPELWPSGFPRLALGAISFIGTEYVDAGSCSDPTVEVQSRVLKLVRVDPPTSRLKWALEISSPRVGGGLGITNPVLTSRSTVVFSQATDYCSASGQYVMREVSPSGEPSWSCPLPGDEVYSGEGLLINGTYVSAIIPPDGGPYGVRAIALPGFELPEHGWATAWGSPQRDNHAR